jgi:hypothetical protein
MARRIARRGAGQRLFAIFGRGCLWDNRANSRPRARPHAATGAARQRLRSLPWRAFHPRTRPFSSFGRGRAKTPDHDDWMPRFARIAGGHCRYGTGELIIARNDPSGAPLDDCIDCLALASIVQGFAKLRTFPWIAKREQLGKRPSRGVYFGISTAALLALDGVSGRFDPSRPGRIAPPLPGRPHGA